MADNAILMGNRSVSVLDANGNPVSGEEAAKIAIPGLQQMRGDASPAGAAAPGSVNVNPLKAGASWYNEHMGNLAGAGAYGLDQVINPVARAVGFEPTPFKSVEEAQAKAKGLVPNTPSGVATQVAGGPLVGRFGLIGGTAIGTGGGAAVEGLSGGDPVKGAITGGVGTAVPGVLGKATNAGVAVLQKIATKTGLRDVTAATAQRMLDGLEEDAPTLYNALKKLPGSAPAKLAQMHDPDVWQGSMGKLMDQVEKPIIKAVPQIPARVQPASKEVFPGLTKEQAAKMAAIGLRPPGSQAVVTGKPKMVSMEDALKELKDLKADAAKAYDPAHPQLTRQLREAADDWENRIVQEVNKVNPALAQNWAKAVDQYNRAMRYKELSLASIENAGASASQTPFDVGGLIRRYWAGSGSYQPSRLPGFNKHFFPGEPGSAMEVEDPGLYARAFMPMGAKFNIPVPKFVTQPGVQYGAPNAAAGVANAARAGVIPLSETAQRQR